MNPQPFPWQLVSRTTHADAHALRDARRWLHSRGAFARLVARLGELARTTVEIRLLGASLGAAAPRSGSIAIAFSFTTATEHRFVIVAENALAAGLIARAMKRSAPRIVDTKRAPPLPLTGAFAAMLMAA